MYKRTWTPTQTETAYTGTITFYDSGIVCGELFNDSWLSWEILDRKKEDGKIIETLRELSQDYVPFQVLHTETHEAVEDSTGNICIPGWTITYEMSNPSAQTPALQEPPLQAPQLKPPPLKQARPPVIQASQPAPRPPPRPQLPAPWVPPQQLEVPKQLLEAPPTQMTKVLPSSGKTVPKPTKNRRQNAHQGSQKKHSQPVEVSSVSYPPHLQPLAETLLMPPLLPLAPSSSPQQKKLSHPLLPLQAQSPVVKGARQQRRRRSEKHMKEELPLTALVDNPSTHIGRK